MRLIDNWMQLNGFTVTNFFDGGQSPPRSSGVYVFTTTQPMYVGSSVNLAKRLQYHEVRSLVKGCLVWWKKAKNFIADETALIRELRPLLNVIHNGDR